MYSLPNILTISRIVVIPVIFLSIYIHSTLWAVLTAILFIVAAITDYFDGYLARSRNETSAFGRLLDPIADKLLVVSALLILVANHMVLPISYIPVIVILCREVLVSGLREFFVGSQGRNAGYASGQVENGFSDDGNFAVVAGYGSRIQIFG